MYHYSPNLNLNCCCLILYYSLIIPYKHLHNKVHCNKVYQNHSSNLDIRKDIYFKGRISTADIQEIIKKYPACTLHHTLEIPVSVSQSNRYWLLKTIIWDNGLDAYQFAYNFTNISMNVKVRRYVNSAWSDWKILF